MLKLIATTALVLSACVGDGIGGSPGPIPVEDGKEFDPATDGPTDEPTTFSFEADTNPDDTEVCNLLPPGDDACAHACDPDALAGYIPEGTCATFDCTLIDGSSYSTGGCNI